jgi:hypothetical protein
MVPGGSVAGPCLARLRLRPPSVLGFQCIFIIFLEEFINMTRYGLVCLLLGAMAWAQAPNSTPAPAQKPAAAPATSQAGTAAENKEPDLSKVAPDATIITIQGVCDNPPADKTKSPDCKTLITRAQFEKIVDAVQPQMNPRARRQFASRYANALIMSTKAHEMGLDQGAEFEQRMQLQRISVLSQMLGQAEQKKAAEISDKEIEDYYKASESSFEEADVLRIFIPRVQQLPTAKEKLSDAEEQKRQKDAEETMKKEADTLHTRAVAGEDFDKLQAEAFKVGGIQSKSPTSKMDKVRRNHLPPGQASAMDLKVGEISAVLSDQSGYFVFKMVKKETLALDAVKDEIKGTLRSQKLQDQMQAIEHSATANLDEAYFGPEAQVPTRPIMPPPGRPGSK